MKTKETFYYIPTIGRHKKVWGISTIPGPAGLHEETSMRYFLAFLDNIWPIRDRDIPVYILPGILVLVIILGFILL